jgi:uncharacterized protein YndB with AHSA1/START domain
VPELSKDGTTVVSLEMDGAPEDVFAVLADGDAYDDWVVGAKQIRCVDANWPAQGSRFHHEVGVGPASVKDSTTVLEVEPPHHIRLEVRFRPAGVAIVDLRMEPIGDGRTRVRMAETPTRGAARALAAVTSVMLLVRNEWSLRRLRRLVAQKAGAVTG